MKHLFCHTALVGVGLAMLTPAAVFAQVVQGPSAEPAELDEIVVTATRRATNVLDVPVAVSTYDSKALERAGLADVKRLQSISPSLNVTTTQGDSQGAVIRVRGVGTSGSNPGLESATGVSIDGVFRSRSNVALGDLLAIDRIELLRGPQGTLFGKNTTAGVINILTKLPVFTPGAELTAILGNYNLQQYSAGVTGPIVGDTLAGRLDVLYSRRDGWLKSRYSSQTYADRQREAIRGQLYWTPSDNLEARVIADYTKRDESTANPPTYRLVGPTGLLIGAFGPKPEAENQPISDAPQIDNKSPRVDRYEEMGLSGEAKWKVGPGTLTSITAYRVATPNRSFDVEGSPADLLRDIDDGERYRTFTQEVRYQGVAGKLDYLAGGFYSDERILSRDGVKTAPGYDQFIVGLLGGVNYLTAFTGLPLGSNYQIGSGQTDVFNQKSRSFALFTHNSYKATDRLTVTGGLRLTTESKALTADLKSTGDGCNAAIARFGSSLTGIPASLRSIICGAAQDPRYAGALKGDRNESEWSGTASAGYKFAERLNGYLSYSRGYKGGGYQYDRTGLLLAGPAISQLSFTPEFADSYEAGLKGVFLEGKLRGNAAVFYTKISDYQFNYLKVLPLQSARVTANLPELVSKGVELDGAFRPIANLTLTAAATYNEVAYGDSDFPTGLTQLQGTMAPYAPRWSLQSAFNYEHVIPGTALEGFVYLDANWRSTTNLSFSATTTPIYFQKSYALANMRVGVGRQDGQWQVEAFAKNLFDKHAWSGLYTATAQSGSVAGFFIEPRFYGVALRAKFGG